MTHVPAPSSLTTQQATSTISSSTTPLVLVTSPSPDPALPPSRDTMQSVFDAVTSNVTITSPLISPRTLSSTSLHEDSMRNENDEDEAIVPLLEISDLERILEDELNKLQDHTTEKDHLRLRRLLDILLGGVVSAYSNPFSGSNRLEGFVMIEKVHRKVESKSGIRLPLDKLLAQIETVVILSSGGDGGYARRLARDFDGRFTSRIPWDTIWWEYLLDPHGVNRSGQTRPPLHETILGTSNGQPASVLPLLPQEIIRYILHLGAESFLPIARSSLYDRRILHLRRSHFLTNAALTHSSFRRQAQLELVSFAYCRRGYDVDSLLDFVARENALGSLGRIRIDYDDEEGEDEEEAFGTSLLRLSQSHAELEFIDFGGTFSARTLALFQNSLHLHTIKFTEFSTATWPRFDRELYKLSPSVINLYMDSCHLESFSQVFQANPNILKITLLHNRPTNPKALIITRPHFYNTTHVRLDYSRMSIILLMKDFPSVTQVEFLHCDANLSWDPCYDQTSDLECLWEKLSIKLVVMPRILYDLMKQDTLKEFERRGIVVRCVEDSDCD